MIEVIQDDMNIPKTEYDIYSKINGTNLEKLDKSICKDVKVSLFIPINITESLDKLNISSNYYNDICYTATSDKGTDIILKDRQNELINNNKAICEDDCDFTSYYYNISKAKCECKVKETSLYFKDIKINKTKLYQNFVDIKNIANIKILFCYKILFTKEGLVINLGLYILSVILLVQIILILIFRIKDFNKIKKKIKDIYFSIIKINALKCDNNQKSTKNKKDIKNNISLRKQKNNIFTKIKRPIKQINKNSSKNKKVINKNNNYIKKNNYKSIKFQDKKFKNNVSSFNTKRIINTINSKRKNIPKFKSTKTIKSNQIKNNKIKNVLKRTDEELNNLSYNLALQYDSRTYMEYYFSLIKTKHPIVFSFCFDNDYNSKSVKISLFFISFVVSFTVNALFYSDDTMHYLYQHSGKYDLEYKLPKIIYSTLISKVINIPLNILALSHNSIVEFKKDKNKNNIIGRYRKLINKIILTSIIYFFSSFIVLSSFLYYLSLFCAIYKNTQYHLVEDTLISYGISLIYPIVIYLLPGAFRIPSLRDPKKKRSCMYTFGKILQLL